MQNKNQLIFDEYIQEMSDKPKYLKLISQKVAENLTPKCKDAINNLYDKYDGTNRDINGNKYCTLYTTLRKAIQYNDIGIVKTIIDNCDYLPLSWDMLAFDIYTPRMYNICKSQFGPRGKLIYNIINNKIQDYKISELKPYIDLNLNITDDNIIDNQMYQMNILRNYNNIFDEKSKNIDLLIYPYRFGCINLPDNIDINNIFYLINKSIQLNDNSFLYKNGISYYIIRDLLNYIENPKNGPEILQNYIYLYDMNFIPTKLINDPNIDYKPRDYPYIPYKINIDTAIIYDRVDLFDMIITNDPSLIDYVLKYTKISNIDTNIEPIGPNIRNYLTNMKYI